MCYCAKHWKVYYLTITTTTWGNASVFELSPYLQYSYCGQFPSAWSLPRDKCCWNKQFPNTLCLPHCPSPTTVCLRASGNKYLGLGPQLQHSSFVGSAGHSTKCPKTRQSCLRSATWLALHAALPAASQLPGEWHLHLHLEQAFPMLFLLAYGVFICFGSPQKYQLSHHTTVGDVPIWCLSIQHTIFMLLLQSCWTLGF